MAISRIKQGAARPDPYHFDDGGVETEYDYSHVLPKKHRDAGYKIEVTHKTYPEEPDARKVYGSEVIYAHALHNGKSVGRVEAIVKPSRKHWEGPAIEPHSHLDEEHRGKGLGKAMYEAAYAHAYKNGIRQVEGGPHTAAASAVHESLAAKHGFVYQPDWSPEPEDDTHDPEADDFDQERHNRQPRDQHEGAYGDYRYTLKSEDGVDHDHVLIGPGRGLVFSRTDQEPRTVQVALVTAYDSQGRLLLGKRLDNGKWTLPGGHLEEGEDPAEGARRELLEETSLEAQGLSPVTVYMLRDGTVLHCFSAYVTGEPHGADDPDHEVEDWKFVEVGDGIPKNIASKLHGPKDVDENLLLKLFSLQKSEREYGESLGKSVDPLVDNLVPGMLAIKSISHMQLHRRGATCGRHPQGCAMHVQALVDATKKGASLPPVVVFKNPHDKLFNTADGHHRLAAASQLGQTEVPVLIREPKDPSFGKSEPDEIERLLQHPNPHERSMALLLANLEPKHLDIAAQDEDPSVHARAVAHPKFTADALMQSGKTKQQLAFLALPKGPRPEHLVTLYERSIGHPDQDVLHAAIVGHTELGQDLARALYRDPRVSFQARMALMKHPNLPQDVMSDAVNTALLAPGDWAELAKLALVHPTSHPSMAEEVVRKAMASKQAHHQALADHVLRNRWVSPSLIDDILDLARVRRDLQPLAEAALTNPAASEAQSHKYLENMLRPTEPVQKSEPDNLQSTAAHEAEVIQAMLGYRAHLTDTFQAAAFLAGGGELPFERVRRALWAHEGDLEAAALAAYGYEVNDANRAALRSVLSLETVRKSEPVAAQAREVVAAAPEGEDVAEAVLRAFKDQFVFPVKLDAKAKHSAGTLLARDSKTGTTWLLKPGSGGQSTAAGAGQDPSTQSAREAAWAQVAQAWGLDAWFPRAELLIIDGKQFAALRLLPWAFKPLEKKRATDPALGRRVMQPLLTAGTLHRLAILDFVCGNPDRHGSNVMVDDEGQVRLIDHGSAFAGSEFDPGHDQNSFVPYYLRAWSPDRFNALTPEQKYATLPRVNAQVAADIKTWVENLSGERLAAILHRYGINPAATMARLERVKQAVAQEPADAAINRLWVTT